MYENRIVGHGEESPDQLLANPYNFRIHGKGQQQALHNVMSDIGVVQSVIVNRISGHIIDGHLRVALALRNDQPTVPVTYVELSESEEKTILATFDPISAMAGIDEEKLAELLQEVEVTDGIESVIDDLKVDAGIMPPPIDNPEVLPTFDKTFIVLVELDNYDDYQNVKLEMERRGYKVRGNQK
jgi:hypothetical protein